jgi:uncharacterized protein
MSTVMVRRAPVKIQRTPLGHGVFATRNVRRKQMIGYVLGRTISDPNYDSPYCIDLDRGRRLEPFAPYRYLNHSCDPNAEICYDVDDGSAAPKLWIQSLRPIAAGEEITIDYQWPVEMAVPCRCESPRCRGWVVDGSEMHLLARHSQ